VAINSIGGGREGYRADGGAAVSVGKVLDFATDTNPAVHVVVRSRRDKLWYGCNCDVSPFNRDAATMTDILLGKSYPLGATITPAGVNFSVHSKSCSAMELLLFDHVDDGKPARVIKLDPSCHRTFHYWHVEVVGIGAGQVYAFRADGPYMPEHGLRFDGKKVLLDPYGRAVSVPDAFDRDAGACPGDNAAFAMKSVVADLSSYDWEGDMPLYRPFDKTIIYEMHVGGFTKHPSSGVAPDRQGTYLGLIEKIPYLQSLGITAVELLPIFQFDPQEAPPGLTNYWGYNPVSFFAPHLGYGTTNDPLKVLDEFRDMVKALHRAGIEVLLDVVYNHTAEGDQTGPTFVSKASKTWPITLRNPIRFPNTTAAGTRTSAAAATR
jgi:isoamylase